MERPSLNPSVHLEAGAQGPPPPRPGLFRRAVATLGRLVRIAFTPIPLLTRPHEAEEHSPLVRFARGLVYRLAAVPFVLAVIVGTLVYTATHPARVQMLADPSSLGLYFEKVKVVATDGVVSEGWLVPVVDARRVLEQKDEILTTRHPAVVLVHDHASSRQELLPYLRPFHDAGIVTLTVAVRGGSTDDPRGRTFGLRESLDAGAAVNVLRSRSMTDPERVGVVGLGSGATAALLAAQLDTRIAVVAAIDPARDAAELVAPIGPTQGYLSFLRPLVRFAFETVFDVDSHDANLARLSTALKDRKVLYVLSDEHTTRATNHFKTVTDFVHAALHPPTDPPVDPPTGEAALPP